MSEGFFDLPPGYESYWWGMPAFEQADARPQHRVVINFETLEDLKAFAKVTGLKLTAASDTAWFPPKSGKRRYYWKGPRSNPRYPICIPSKGRFDTQRTATALDRMGVDEYLFFVEETEAGQYIEKLGEEHVVVMPFHDLGRGSIPARNFIWEWVKEREHARHWVVDDNIISFARCYRNKRWRVFTGAFFRAMEDFVDRYENVAMAGPHDKAFVQDADPNLTPVLWNSRIYSCILLDTDLEERWRGKYNEDTDLSLRLLKRGLVTALFRALLIDKPTTAGGKGKAVAGGNTDTVYATGDRRRAFAESLKNQHPDVVEVVWKFHRWHHSVDYSPFARNKPKLKRGVVPTAESDEYGMTLHLNEGDV